MDIILIGAGGHSKVICDMIHARKDLTLVAVLDDKYRELTKEKEVFSGPISAATTFVKERGLCKFLIAIGDNKVRKLIVNRLGLEAKHFITLIHDTAYVSANAAIDPGTVIMAKAVVQSAAKIGHHTIVNTGAIVEHDVVIEDYVHAAPGAIITGAVYVKEGAMIGAGASVIPSKTIGKWTMIGAGATVTSDISDYCTAVGVPARTIRNAGNYLAKV